MKETKRNDAIVGIVRSYGFTASPAVLNDGPAAVSSNALAVGVADSIDSRALERMSARPTQVFGLSTHAALIVHPLIEVADLVLSAEVSNTDDLRNNDIMESIKHEHPFGADRAVPSVTIEEELAELCLSAEELGLGQFKDHTPTTFGLVVLTAEPIVLSSPIATDQGDSVEASRNALWVVSGRSPSTERFASYCVLASLASRTRLLATRSEWDYSRFLRAPTGKPWRRTREAVELQRRFAIAQAGAQPGGFLGTAALVELYAATNESLVLHPHERAHFTELQGRMSSIVDAEFAVAVNASQANFAWWASVFAVISLLYSTAAFFDFFGNPGQQFLAFAAINLGLLCLAFVGWTRWRDQEA